MDDITRCMMELTEKLDERDDLWDCIVISAADVEQKEGFERQIKQKLDNDELPKSVNYFVIADPGPSVGSGGASFHVLNHLYNLYGEDLYCKKVWVVHAGGCSKRLPNFSCLGKLFCPLPMERNGKTCSILNIKLLATLPLAKLIPHGGVFFVGSDDIETYCLDGFHAVTANLSGQGVVALAHPSTVTIGTTHGVYVMPTSHPVPKPNCWVSSCLEVLQKPNYATMKARQALFSSGQGEEEQVYTDSMFCCGPDVVKKMVAFAQECSSDLYKEETCIYGDFLACMGTRPAEEKLYWREISATSAIKRRIAEYFQETRLDILVLEKSRFYHLGTMPEYLENLHPTAQLFRTLGMKSIAGCQCNGSARIDGVAINSLLRANVQIRGNSIMDHCVVDVPTICEERTIISHCHIQAPDGLESITIPPGWLFHTAALMREGVPVYVTVAFPVDDDLKGSAEASQSWKYAGISPKDTTLWKAKLFQAKESMSTSFMTTWKEVTGLTSDPPTNLTTSQRFSMEDVVKFKYIPTMLEFREYVIRETKLHGAP